MIREYSEIFCWKNVSSFCSAKATHIFSAKNIRILNIESAKTVNEMTLNELVKLTTVWTTGPCFLARLSYAQDELLWSFFVRRPSILPSVRPSVRPLTFSNNFSEAAEPVYSNFIWSLLRLGEQKIAKMVVVRWPRWPSCPYLVKTFKNLLQNWGCLGAESLHKSSGMRSLPKLLK